MTNEDLFKYLESKEPKNNDRDKIIEWVFRGFLALLVWLGLQLNNDVEDLKNNVQKITTQRHYSELELENFRTFVQKPRFTRTDYDNLITPIQNQIHKNTAELERRGLFLNKVESRLIKLEYDKSTK